MEIIGALSKSNTKSVVYFCRFGNTEIEIASINRLIQETGYSEKIYGSKIKALAIESTDDFKTDKRLVGMIFETENQYATIVLDRYKDLDIYLREIAE